LSIRATFVCSLIAVACTLHAKSSMTVFALLRAARGPPRQLTKSAHKSAFALESRYRCAATPLTANQDTARVMTTFVDQSPHLVCPPKRSDRLMRHCRASLMRQLKHAARPRSMCARVLMSMLNRIHLQRAIEYRL